MFVLTDEKLLRLHGEFTTGKHFRLCNMRGLFLSESCCYVCIRFLVNVTLSLSSCQSV